MVERPRLSLDEYTLGTSCQPISIKSDGDNSTSNDNSDGDNSARNATEIDFQEGSCEGMYVCACVHDNDLCTCTRACTHTHCVDMHIVIRMSAIMVPMIATVVNYCPIMENTIFSDVMLSGRIAVWRVINADLYLEQEEVKVKMENHYEAFQPEKEGFILVGLKIGM